MNLFYGCASVPKKTPEARLEVAAIAKDVIKGEISSSIAEETEIFSSDDPQAVAWIKLGEMSESHNLRWEWYDPKGKLYYRTDNYGINSDGKYMKFNTAWHKLIIKDDDAANLPGRWQVKIFLDEKFITARQFEIKKPVSVALEKKLPSLRPDTFAIVIGIDYKGRLDIPNLQYPSQDAKKIYEALTDVRYGGVPKENTRLLLNEQATRNAIITAMGKIKNWDGYVYVYYSGHGAPRIEQEKMVDALLVPYDVVITDPEAMESTSIKVSQLQKYVDSSQAKGILVALDACFTGSGSKSIMAEGGKPLVGMMALTELIKTVTSNKIIITSSDANEQSWEDDAEIKGGIFSYYLIEGLKGKAGRDVWVKADDLAEYVKTTVPTAVKKLKGEEQNPQISGKGDFAVARNLSREKYIDNARKKLANALINKNLTEEQLNKAMTELKTREPSRTLQLFLDGRINEKEFGELY